MAVSWGVTWPRSASLSSPLSRDCLVDQTSQLVRGEAESPNTKVQVVLSTRIRGDPRGGGAGAAERVRCVCKA